MDQGTIQQGPLGGAGLQWNATVGRLLKDEERRSRSKDATIGLQPLLII